MKHFISFIVLLSFISSCSTLKKSITLGTVLGGTIGATGGAALSPDSYSKMPNAVIWGGLGALTGAALGYYLFNDDPENKELPQMILPEPKTPSVEDVALPVIVPVSSKKYKVEKGPLPEDLRDKIPNPYIIEHLIPERVETLNNGRTLKIDEHKAYEVMYE